MIYRLGDLDLPPSLQWVDRYGWQPVVQSMQRNLGGAQVTWSQPLQGGRPITLVAEADVTWLEQSHVDGLDALARQAGATFTLVWGGFAATVRFRHHEPPALDLAPHWPHADRFGGTIKLIEI